MEVSSSVCPEGLTGWEWFWVVVAGLFDIVHWAASASQRSQLPGRRSTV
jgi:hypothetical protein